MLMNTKDIETTGSLGGEFVPMSIDMASLSKIMNIFTDLYSDPIAAVVREYITNGIDAHTKVGQTKPVEVTTPTVLSPFFVVQDYGVGMSHDDLVNIYGLFGKSTKSGSNDETGMFGLGCKSALTYTEQFTLITVKDGVRYMVNIRRIADGTGGLELIGPKQTDEPNGTTVRIPVNNEFEEFHENANSFATYAPSKVIVDGIASDTSQFEKINDKIWLRNKNRYYTMNQEIDRVVMGDVSYPASSVDQLSRRHQVIYFADMAEFDVTPTREELMYTSHTKNGLENMRREYEKALSEHLQHKIDACASVRLAWNQQVNLNRQYGTTLNFKYQGKMLPTDHGTLFTTSWSSDGSSISRSSEYDNGNIEKQGTLIYNWTNVRFTRTQVRKLNQYCKDNAIDAPRSATLLRSDSPNTDLFDNDWMLLDWEDIKATKMNETRVAGKKVVRRWESYNKGWIEIDTAKPVYYASRAYLRGTSCYENDVISVDGNQFVYVPDRQQSVFLKLHPTAKPIREFYYETVKKYIDGMTPEKQAKLITSDRFPNADYLDNHLILDPKVKLMHNQWSTRMNRDDEDIEEYRQMEQWYNRIPTQTQRATLTLPTVTHLTTEDILEPYLLLTSANLYMYGQNRAKAVQHMTDYVNMVYTNNQGV